jgi:hypothetical protein
LATALTVLFSLEALALVGLAAAHVQETDILRRIQDAPLTVSANEVDANQDLLETMSGLTSVVGLALCVVLIIWLHRATTNARTWGHTRWSPGWAIGGWFIPFANAVIPWKVIHQADVASRRDAGRGGGPFAAWVTLTTVGFLVTTIARNVYDNTANDAVPDITRGIHAGQGLAFGAGLLVVAAVLAIVNVRRISAAHEAR